jgi:hypothetical protein
MEKTGKHFKLPPDYNREKEEEEENGEGAPLFGTRLRLRAVVSRILFRLGCPGRR